MSRIVKDDLSLSCQYRYPSIMKFISYTPDKLNMSFNDSKALTP